MRVLILLKAAEKLNKNVLESYENAIDLMKN
jgi:hypothetical protein